MPVLEVDAVLAGRERYDSWVSIPEIPGELRGGGGLGENAYGEVEGFDFDGAGGDGEESWGESQRVEDLGLLKGVAEEVGDESQDTVTGLHEVEGDGRKDSRTSVWEDGESYWSTLGDPEKHEELHLDSVVMAAKRDSGNRSRIEHRRIAQLRGEMWEDQKVLGKQKVAETPPPVNIQPPSPGSCGSPRSLYDENGFYKDE